MKKADCRVLVVGAGLAGLTVAAYLARAGFSVSVVEKTKVCGGLLNSFERNGFLFDSGARSIENAGVIRPMIADLGLDVELLASPVSLSVESSIVHFDSERDITEYQAVLEHLYPLDYDAIRRIFKKIKRVMREMDVIYGFDNPVFKDFKHDKKYLFSVLLPWLGRFLLAIHRMNRMQEPVESYLAKLASNQSLIDIIDQHFFKRTPTFFALGYYYVYLDYLYPKGGTGKLAQALVQSIISHGGSIATETSIASINPNLHIAVDGQGMSRRYDKLVWCADLKQLYRCLDLSGFDEKAAASIRTVEKEVCASRGGDSVFSLYLGVNQAPEVFGRITHGHLFHTPLRQGLGNTHLKELDALLAQGSALAQDQVLAWVKRYAELTTYEISIPSLRDPDLSPQGKTGMIASFLLSYDLVQLVEQAGWYTRFKTFVEDCMIDVMNRTLFPGFSEQVVLRFSSSPASIERIFGNSEGGITGWTFEQPSPVVDSLTKIPKAVKTPIPDVLQAGQWAYSPAGIPTAILTGWYAFDALQNMTECSKIS